MKEKSTKLDIVLQLFKRYVSIIVIGIFTIPFGKEIKAQAMGLNQATPNAASILDAVATDRGILIPRMTTAQRTAIGTPVEGLLVYDTDLDELYYYDATATANWRPVLAGSKASTGTAGNITMADGTLLDMSAINPSSTTEGLKLPQAASITAATAEGQVSWDTDEDLLQIGTGAAVKTIGIPNNIQVFTASGVWTRPANVTQVWVKVWGAGGAGVTGTANSSGGGGGGGGYSEGFVAVTGDVVVTVGTGGAVSGAAGGLSSFAGTTTITANGGSGAAATAGGAGGAAGAVGTVLLAGGAGGAGVAMDGAGGGKGGGSPKGGDGGSGGPAANASNPAILGRAGTIPGGGGGGGSEDTGVFGAGAAGLVIVYY